MIQATDNESSALRRPLFPPGVIDQNVPRLRTILPAKPNCKEQEAAVESKEVYSHTTRKLPPGIAPSEMKQPSKSFEILLNSGLRNSALVNL